MPKIPGRFAQTENDEGYYDLALPQTVAFDNAAGNLFSKEYGSGTPAQAFNTLVMFLSIENAGVIDLNVNLQHIVYDAAGKPEWVTLHSLVNRTGNEKTYWVWSPQEVLVGGGAYAEGGDAIFPIPPVFRFLFNEDSAFASDLRATIWLSRS